MIEQAHERRILAIIRQLHDGNPVPYNDILQAVHPRFDGNRFTDVSDADSDPGNALTASELDSALDALVQDGRLRRKRDAPHLYTPT